MNQLREVGHAPARGGIWPIMLSHSPGEIGQSVLP